MRSVSSNFLWASGYQVVAAVSPVITAPYLARVLGPSGVGTYSWVVSVGALVSTISLIGTYGFGSRETAYSRDDLASVSRLVSSVMFIRVALGMIGSIVFLAWAATSSLPFEFFAIYAVWLLGNAFDVSWVFIGLEYVRPAVLKNVVSRLVVTGGVFVVVRSADDVGSYLGLTAATLVVANLSVYREVARVLGPVGGSAWLKSWPSGNELAQQLHGSVLLFVPQIPVLVNQYAGRVLIMALVGSSQELAFFDQADKIVGIPLALLTSLSAVAMPRAAHAFKSGDMEGLYSFLIGSVQVTCLAAIPAAVGLMIVGPQFVLWFLGPEFASSGYVVATLAPLLIFSSVGYIASFQYLTAVNSLRVVTWVNVASAGVNVLLNIILVPRLGAVGCAISALVAGALSCLVLAFVMFVRCGLMRAASSLVRYGVYGTVMGVMILVVNRQVGSGMGVVAIDLVLGFVIYLGLLLAFRDQGLGLLMSSLKRLLPRQRSA